MSSDALSDRWRALPDRGRLRRAAPALAGIALCLWALHRLQLETVRSTLLQADWRYFLGVSALLPLQVALSARRWNVLAGELGVSLPPRIARAEYYLSTLLNQLLPGGVSGDAIRVWRHRQRSEGAESPVAAAVLDRGSGFFCLLCLVLLGLLLWPLVIERERPPALLPAVAALLGAMTVLAVVPARVVGSRFAERVRTWRKALLGAASAELWSISALLAMSHVASLALAASAVGIRLELGVLLVLPLVLLPMTLPIAVGTWGPREAAAVVLLPLAGVEAEAAFAFGLLHGAATLLGSLPGLLVLVAKPRSDAVALRSLGQLPLTAPLLLLGLNAVLLLPRILRHPKDFQVLPRDELGHISTVLFTRQGQDFWRVFCEFWLLVTALLLARRAPANVYRWLQRALLGVWSLSLLVEINNLFGQLLMHQDPLLYDEAFLLMHLRILVMDLYNPKLLGGALVALMLLLIVLRGVPKLFRLLGDSLQVLPRPFLPLFALPWLFIIGGTAKNGLASTETAAIWLTPNLAKNLEKSHEIWRSVHGDIEQSPYRALADVRLTRRPDLDLYIVESYGRLVAEAPPTARQWQLAVRSMEEHLAAHGWHSVSAYCRAPVSGGRSWIADASLFMGLHIEYESVYRHLLSHIDRLPNLVSFLNAQGYQSVRLAPGDRERGGLKNSNDWNFGTVVDFETLEYDGPRYGWGIVPDQYALSFFNERLAPRIPTPRFLYFHMVSSHAPWRAPPWLDDWRRFSASGAADDYNARGRRFAAEARERMARFERKEHVQEMYMGRVTELTATQYLSTILYDLRLLEEQLLPDRRDAMIVIMGDHQPPIISRYAESFDVPVHILARDPLLLEELLGWGFRQGMVPPATTDRGLRHDDLFPMLVRALTRADGREVPAVLAPWAR